MAKVLMVATAADHITLDDGSAHPTGFWAEELVVLHRVLTAAGHDVELATPNGVRPPVDPASLDLGTPEGVALRDELDGIDAWLATPTPLAEVRAGDHDAIVLPGGHGPMTDLAHDPDLGRLLVAALDRDLVIGALCHGLAGLLSARRPDGGFAFVGRRIASFTDAEELAGGLGDRSPYLLASTLSGLGADVHIGAEWSSTVVVDGRLVTGQNPQSSTATAEALVTALG